MVFFSEESRMICKAGNKGGGMNMDLSTVFMAFYCWVQDPNVLSGVGQTVLGRATYDVLKTLGDSFIKKMGRFFNSSSEAEKYFETICTKSPVNDKKPYRDVEDLFEEISSQAKDDSSVKEFRTGITEWFKENNEQIRGILISQAIDKPNQNITNQQAGRDINNVQGQQNIYNR